MHKNILQTTSPAVTIPAFVLGLIIIVYGISKLLHIEEKYAEIIAKEKHLFNVILYPYSRVYCSGRAVKGYDFQGKSIITRKLIKGAVCCEPGILSFGAHCKFKNMTMKKWKDKDIMGRIAKKRWGILYNS